MSMLTLMLTANREMCDASLIIQNASFTSYGTALKSYIHDLTPQELKSSRLQVNNLHHALCDVCWLFFCSIPFIIFALLFSLHPSRNSDPGSHSTLFSPLPTTVCTVGALPFLSREDPSSFFPRRLASSCVRLYFYQYFVTRYQRQRRGEIGNWELAIWDQLLWEKIEPLFLAIIFLVLRIQKCMGEK